MDSDLRKHALKLAYQNPELRSALQQKIIERALKMAAEREAWGRSFVLEIEQGGDFVPVGYHKGRRDALKALKILQRANPGGNYRLQRQAKTAAAKVTPVRQRTQYSCMSASMCMALRAHGLDCNEDEVNKVMGARPMQGATWEDAIACAQHYGFRANLVCPASVARLKEWTDRGVPVLIAWNPEGRDWSHASVVFDVDDDGNVHVADPNIPDPDETVRIVPKGDFYKMWSEKWPRYLVRRPACAIEREITADGRQVFASSPTLLQRVITRYMTHE